MDKKVSIILIHYNQSQYVNDALDSVFAQSYSNIELIFADDCSKELNTDNLKKYCLSKNKKKYKIIWQINTKNIGTVKTVNRAVKKSSGDYILIFAADDKLYDKEVISKLVKSFSTQNKNTAIVSGQCFMMDKKLESINYKFVDYLEGEEFNKKEPLDQYKKMTQDCFLAMGACMIDARILKKEGLFSEKYKFIEDWYIFLKLTKSGYKLIFDKNINALLHRDGGISHTLEIVSLDSPVVSFRKDLINLFLNEVLPNFYILNYTEKCNVYDFLTNNISNYERLGLKINNFNRNFFRISNIMFFIHRKASYINMNYDKFKNNLCNNLSIVNSLFILIAMIYEGWSKVTLYLAVILVLLNILAIMLILIIRVLYKSRILKDT